MAVTTVEELQAYIDTFPDGDEETPLTEEARSRFVEGSDPDLDGSWDQPPKSEGASLAGRRRALRRSR